LSLVLTNASFHSDYADCMVTWELVDVKTVCFYVKLEESRQTNPIANFLVTK
jgi:hypothetical protein